MAKRRLPAITYRFDDLHVTFGSINKLRESISDSTEGDSESILQIEMLLDILYTALAERYPHGIEFTLRVPVKS